MKSLIVSILFLSFNLKAEVSRAPAVVGGTCDLDIPTTKILKGSEKVFYRETPHQVSIISDDSQGCLVMPDKQYPKSIYEEHARNEMELLFQKYSDTYSTKCRDYFKAMGLTSSDYVCEKPSIVSISLSQFDCQKQVEDETQKITYVAKAMAIVKYQQTAMKTVEKPLEVVMKEQCKRVNECLNQASESEVLGLKKLAEVACKNELIPVTPGRAPAIEKDHAGFDGNRFPKEGIQKDADVSGKDQKTNSATGK